MKKITSLLICLTLALAAFPAFAEEEGTTVEVQINRNFQVTAVVPEGYTYFESYPSDILYIGHLVPSDPSMAQAALTIAYDELADGRTLNDYSEEELDAMIRNFLLDTPEAVVSTQETGEGTKVLIFRTETEAETRVDMVTLWRGYQVAVMLLPGEEGQPLNDSATETIMNFLTGVQISEIEK